MRATGFRPRCLALLFLAVVAGIIFVKGYAQSQSDEPASRPSLTLKPIITKGLAQPLYLTHAGDGSGRLFVVEQAGRIRILTQGTLQSLPFLDISDLVLAGGERGLLGLAFHPDYARNGRLFVSYTRQPDGATVVAEYRRNSKADLADRQERVVMVVPQPFANHNGGMIAFGPDGALYIGRGDGGGRGDPDNRGQNPHDLRGKILRLDMDRGEPYAIPADNPYASGGGRPEIYALGLRNPWRFSFDRETGSLWVGDVGQHAWEEVDVVVRGGNYGWRLMEGRHCFLPQTDCDGPGLRLPLLEYGHEAGRCSITGGYVYRGPSEPALKGLYVYGDYCSGEIFGARVEAEARPSLLQNPQVLLRSGLRISSFGEDETGEVYVVDHGGGVYRLESSR
ncbi:MAG: PQQ-dependent sugar dehydrogenase [Nitrospira defluvii]|nr:PQQ-dependent sugar dehydrogenase [Nitrospira defluvii]